MSKTTNTIEIHYFIEAEILITSTPQGRPACMSQKVYTVHKASQASWSLFWTDIPSGVHHTMKHASLVMQKGQQNSHKDVSWRRPLLPQWLTQPFLPICNRPPGKAAVRVLTTLAQKHISEILFPVHPLQQGRGSYVLHCCRTQKLHASRTVHEVCILDQKKHISVLPMQFGSTGQKNWASIV